MKRSGIGSQWVVLVLGGALGCNLMLGNEQPGEYVADTFSSGGVMTGGSNGSGGAPESGGSLGTGGTVEVTSVGAIGEPCAPSGVYACAGQNQRVQLTCVEGKWSALGTCESTERCDTRLGHNAGVCESVVSACEDKEPGAAVQACVGNAPQVCGADRVSLESEVVCEATLGCVAGTCQSRRSECFGQAENTWVCAANGTERIQCGPNETEASRQVCSRACTGGWCDVPSCEGLATTCGPTA